MAWLTGNRPPDPEDDDPDGGENDPEPEDDGGEFADEPIPATLPSAELCPAEALGREHARLSDENDALDRRHMALCRDDGLEATNERAEIDKRMAAIQRRMGMIEEQGLLVMARSAGGAMFQLGLLADILHQLADPDCPSHPTEAEATRWIARRDNLERRAKCAIFSILGVLERVAGGACTAKDVGASVFVPSLKSAERG